MKDKGTIKRAKDFSQKVYANAYRDSGENYFEHVLRTVEILRSNGIEDELIISATYLNKVLETEPSLDKKVLKDFGEDIYNLILSYRALANGPIKTIEPTKANQNLLLRTYLNLAKDPKALIIRLAIKVDNIETIFNLSKEKSYRIAERALYLYAPLSKMLGFYSFVRVLEDSAFKILNPGEYYKIQSHLNENSEIYEKHLEDTRNFVLEILKDNKIKSEVSYRIKHIYSVYAKSQKEIKKFGKVNIKNLRDLAAMRILVGTEQDCYFVEDLLKQAWNCIPEERDDYIQNPKPNGYKSIHNVFSITDKLNLEVQIRTFEMHQNNEYGYASHAAYKIGKKLEKTLKEDPNFIKDLNYGYQKQNIKINKFSKNIYVFTPKGDIKELLRGSKILDFAYTIHRDLGNSCIGGEVNGKFHSADLELQDGDMVKVKTSSHKKKPSPHWIQVVKTRKAREEIRKALRKESLS